jgi:predicted Zn finger-like uncharacterized protein
MILTCPECATSYLVDEAKIPPEGRTVRCASCEHRWTAFPAAAPEPAPEPEPAAAQEAPLTIESVPVSALPGEALPKVFRAKADTSRRVREAAATGIVWAAMAAGLAVMIALAIVFRIDVVRLWPKSAAAYASVGLPVNSLGLAIEGVRYEPSLQEGHAALSVSGMIRNIEDHSISAPPLRIRLLNANGDAVAAKIARPADPRIPPGETRHFALVLLDPPKTARVLEVAFDASAPPPAGSPDAHHGDAPVKTAPLRGSAEALAPPAEHGPAPVDAQPLPDHSPDALDSHG